MARGAARYAEPMLHQQRNELVGIHKPDGLSLLLPSIVLELWLLRES